LSDPTVSLNTKCLADSLTVRHATIFSVSHGSRFSLVFLLILCKLILVTCLLVHSPPPPPPPSPPRPPPPPPHRWLAIPSSFIETCDWRYQSGNRGKV